MALIKCPECGKEISSFAEMCPNCGCPKNRIEMLRTQSSNTPEEDYEEGRKCYSEDENKGLYLLERAANNGHAEAHNFLGLHYMKKDDYKQAVYWWEKGAQLGEIYCLFNAGKSFVQGLGVKKSLKKGIEYLEKSGEMGYGTACIYLGELYFENSDDLDPTEEKSFYWYSKGASLNEPLGQLEVGCKYAYGYGVEKSITKAIDFLEKAAEQNVERAYLILGKLYDESPELKVNRAKGKKWLLKALKSEEYQKLASQLLLTKYGNDLEWADLEEMGIAIKNN